MSNLNLSSIELRASTRKVPFGGAPASQDWNAFQEEVLSDLAEIATLINDDLLPALNALPAAAAGGLDGMAIYADRNSDSPLLRDAQGTPYTLTEVIAKVAAAQDTLASQVAEVQARILVLQKRLATTNQSDLRSSVQSLQNSVASLSGKLADMLGDVATYGARLAGMRRLVLDIGPLVTGNTDLDVVFAPAMSSDNYAVSLAVEGTSSISVVSFVKKENGAGLTVTLLADASSPSGKLHVTAQSL
jgi:hypothetical protein